MWPCSSLTCRLYLFWAPIGTLVCATIWSSIGLNYFCLYAHIISTDRSVTTSLRVSSFLSSKNAGLHSTRDQKRAQFKRRSKLLSARQRKGPTRLFDLNIKGRCWTSIPYFPFAQEKGVVWTNLGWTWRTCFN